MTTAPNHKVPDMKRPSRGRWLRRVAVVLLLGAVLVGVWYVVVRASASANAVRIRVESDLPAGTGRPDGTLRIGTWNIAHIRGLATENSTGESTAEREARATEIARQIAAHDLDIVILNEADFDCNWSGRVNYAELIAIEAGYRFRLEQRNVDVAVPFYSMRFGNVILSRFPIVAAERVDFPTHKPWQAVLIGKKQGALATIELSDTLRLQVAPIHLDHRWGGHEIRSASLARVVGARDETMPLVLAGDFNTSLPGFPGVRAARVEKTALSMLLDGEFTTTPQSAPEERDLTFRADNPTRVIDWVFVPATWDITSREVIDSDLSDHRMVVLEAQIR